MRSLAALMIISTLSAMSASAQNNPRPRMISLVSVLASPSEFHRQRIEVVGYVHFEFEGDRLCLREEDHKAGLISNCFWLDASGRTKDERKAVQDTYALVVGTFDATAHGHRGMFQGSFHSISRLAPWR